MDPQKISIHDLTEADTELIIEEVRNRELLWNVKSDDYKNTTKLTKAWMEIAELLSDEKRLVTGMFF